MTTYKHINSAVPVPLTARVYADGVEVHIFHELADCIHYQWFYDDLLGGGAVEVNGATSKEYQVDLTQVSSSGEYYCEIKVGMTGCNDQVTERRRVSIIECLDQTDRTFAATGASGSVRVNAPHYETALFNDEGNTWIVPSGTTTCDTMVVNVCTYVQDFTLSDQLPSANSARRGQPSMTVGSLVCFFNIGQDYIRTQAANPVLVVPDPPAGPVITLSTSGPVFTEDNVVIRARISYVAVPGQTTPTIPDGLDVPGPVFTLSSAPPLDPFNYLVNFDNKREFATDPVWQQKFTRTTAQIVTVTATYTDANGLTATASIDTEFQDRTVLPTTFSGGTPSAQLDWLNIPQQNGFFGFIPGRNANRQSNLSFSFGGAALWEMNIIIHPWGVTPARPSIDRVVKLTMNGFLGRGSTTGGATSTDGGLDWDDLQAAHSSSATPLMEAPIGGGVVSRTFKFQGIGDIKGQLSLGTTDQAGYDANTDDMNITVLVTIRPQT